MKRAIGLSILCMLVMVGNVDAKHHMGDKSKGHGQGGMMSGCGKMSGGSGMKGGKTGGGKGGHGDAMHGPKGAFHHWMHRVMMHREAFGLSPEQIDRIEAFSALHAQNAIRNKAEHRILKIDYKQALRKKKVDMPSVEKILKKQADLHFRSQKDGVTFYTQVLGLLTPEQKEMIFERIGSPFPHAWDKGRHGGHHMQGGYRGYKRPPKPEPASDKQNPKKT